MKNIGWVRTLVLLCLGLAISACGGSSSGTSGGPAPFDTAKGEGVLDSSSSVTSYATGGSGAGPADDSTVPPLNAYYLATICPSALSQAQCTQNQTNLDTPAFGNFNLGTDPIGNNPLGITSISALKITYGAINVNGAPVTVSGGVVVPQTDAFKGIILYFHGTVAQRSNVPSNFLTDSNPNGNSNGPLLAATWASQGYIVVMPDYIGLGDDTANPHPYVLYPRVNAQSGLAMVKAVQQAHFSHKFHMPLYITGYSEGGAYALEAGRLMQGNPRYASALGASLKDVSPFSGVYDVSGSELPFLLANITAADKQSPPWFPEDPTTTLIAKPYVSADLALSFSHYQNIAATDIVAGAFYNCTSANLPMCGTSGTLDGLFYQSTISEISIITTAFSQATQTDYSGSNNSVTPLLTSTYANALSNQDLSNPLYAAIVEANTYPFTPKFPLALLSLQMDSVVTRVNTDVAFSYMIDKNPKGPYQEILVDNNDFITPGLLFGTAPVDHLGELPFMAIAALNQFNVHP